MDAVEPLVQPVTSEEEDVTGIPAGSELPVRLHLLGHVPDNPRPLRTVKDAAYAWRQTLFFLTMAGTARTGWLHEEARRHAGHVQDRLAPVLAGLDEVVAGGTVTRGRRFTGWAVGGHWMLDAGRSLP
ncbi:hypothetical protein ACFVH6_13715 [Spirillospora sp. NPDC127200]